MDNRFLKTKTKLRIAASYCATWPDATRIDSQEQATQLAKALSAKLKIYYWDIPDPAALGPALRAKMGDGFYMPPWEGIFAADIDHFGATLGTRFQRLLDELTEAAGADVLEIAEVQAALSQARWLRAWRPDIVLTFDAMTQSLAGTFASKLLGVPHVFVLDEIDEEGPLSWALKYMVATATVVVVSEEAIRARIGSELGRVALDKVFMASGEGIVTDEVLAAVRSSLSARKQNQPRLGPRAAFVTREHTAPTPDGADLFVVLGSERTGSTMFVSTFGDDDRTHCIGETFNPRQAAEGQIAWLLNQAGADDELKKLRRDDPGALLRRLRADAGADGLRWIGFKLLYSHSVIDNRLIDALAANPGTPIVHLRRADRIGRAVSKLRASRDDVWTSRTTGATRPPQSAMSINAKELIAEMTECEVFEERHASVFAGHPTINVDYEELCREQATVGSRMQQLLKTDLRLTHPKTVKTGRILRESVANFTELREALKGTPWDLDDHGRAEPRHVGTSAT